MIRTEIKRNICSVWFLLGIALMYVLFMTGDSGQVLRDGSSTTVIAAIWEKLHGNWQRDLGATSSLLMIGGIWTGSQYLPVLGPLFCSLPAILRYKDETENGNKRFIIARGTLRRYYASKFIGGVISAALIMLISTLLYDATVLIFYDWLPVTDDWFWYVYLCITGITPESAADVSWALVVATLVKEGAYFCLYGVMGSALCFFFAALCRSRYTVFGGIILVCYVHNRVYEMLVDLYMSTLKPWSETLMDVVNPEFLGSAGSGGFYGTREWLALIVAAAWILLFYGLAFRIMGRQTDVSER